MEKCPWEEFICHVPITKMHNWSLPTSHQCPMRCSNPCIWLKLSSFGDDEKMGSNSQTPNLF